MSEWRFSDSGNTAVFTTQQVVRQGLAILCLCHDADDGAWQFLCGTTNDERDAMIVGLAEIVRLDATVVDIADLPLGWKAWRSTPAEPWKRAPQEIAPDSRVEDDPEPEQPSS
ncbi:MAG: hypothetical protein AB1486_34220 [Planctomycetota bacterium]